MPEAKTKAKGRTRDRAPTNGAAIAPERGRPCVREGRNAGALDRTCKSANLTQKPSIAATFLFY